MAFGINQFFCNSNSFFSFDYYYYSTRTTMPLNETPVTSPRHSIHHSDSLNSRSPHDNSRNLSGANDLTKQGSPGRQFYSDPRTMSEYFESPNLNTWQDNGLLNKIPFFFFLFFFLNQIQRAEQCQPNDDLEIYHYHIDQ